jgi:hypothetical protein
MGGMKSRLESLSLLAVLALGCGDNGGAGAGGAGAGGAGMGGAGMGGAGTGGAGTGGVAGSGGAMACGGAPVGATGSWHAISAQGAPAARTAHAAVWTGSEMIVFGGAAAVGTPFIDGSRYDPVNDAWRPLAALIAGAASTLGNEAIWTGSEMIVVRGDNGGGARYEPASDRWRAMATAGAPVSGRTGRVAWTGSEILVFNGRGGGRYDAAADTWSTLPAPGAAAQRTDGFSLVWSGAQLLMWGGVDDCCGGEVPVAAQADGATFDPATGQWGALPAASKERRGHLALWAGDEMIVWGGGSLGGERYRPATRTWSPIAATAAPVAQTGVWTGSEMILWGGGACEPSGAAYRPATDTWRPLPTAIGAAARFGHSAVWTGSEVIFWGGGDASTVFGDGVRYRP